MPYPAVQHGMCVQVDDDASDEEIKSAYRQLAKICHPDNAGEKGHNICILLNEVRHHRRTGYHRSPRAKHGCW